MTKVITVYQPHASLIMAGVKTWETRGNPPPSHGVHVQFRPNRVEAEFKDYTGDQTRLIRCEWTHREWCDLMTGVEQLDLFEDAS